MKIIINSNVSYKLPLKILFESLLKSDIKNMSDVIVVLAESDNNAAPRLTQIKSLVELESTVEVVVIESTRRNYDYCGFDVLYKYYGHSLIDSNEYLYLHDTTTVDVDFYSKISKFENLQEDVIVFPPSPNSNIIIFQKNIVTKYKDNFSVDLNKYQAVCLEASQEGVNVNDKWSFNVSKFGVTQSVQTRNLMGNLDIYNTGHSRAILHYDDFGVNKYILYNRDGDLKGKLSDNGI